MTLEEMKAYAQGLLDGQPVKKSEVLAFMRAYLDPDLQAGGPPATLETMGQNLPALGFEVEKTETGIHVPREANRFYTRQEAAALMVTLAKAMK